jgi:hypothetical protein
VSQATLKRIEKTVKRLARDQEALRERLARLERGPEPPAPSTEQVIHFLDRFRAAEALGEASLGAWIAACRTDCLRGGLRTVQMREGSHARLLADRVKELGGTPSCEVPEEQQRAAMEGAASGEKSDAQKVAEFVSRFPDVEAALRPIFELADRLDGDQETQFLLRTIAQDERSTLEFFREACRLLHPEA